jgi:DNA mismatch endonuclease (patch repair protein)
MDIVDARTRSQMMSGIRTKHTQPELLVRSALHSRGFRYSLHPGKLPGRPDITFSKRKVAIFVNGCFWHAHGCHISKMPKTNKSFWAAKLLGNQERDVINTLTLLSAGWRVAVVWECTTRRHGDSEQFFRAMDTLARWICASDPYLELSA